MDHFGSAKEYLENRVELAKNEILGIVDRNFDKKEYELFEEIMKNIANLNGYDLPKIVEKREIFKIIDLMAQKEIFFYDLLKRRITGNNRLYEKAFELLI